MPLKIRRTIQADQDAYDIWEYISADSRQAADRLIRRLDATYRAIAESPDIGRVRPELSVGIRSLPQGAYAIFYRHDELTLTIVRVLSSYRDVTSELFQ